MSEYRSWPYVEAAAILESSKNSDCVTFETGYGPSGFPHIGTLCEVLRTVAVQKAFEKLAPGVKTRLLCVSDDIDALRKVPINVPNKDMLARYIDFPLSSIPDPFGEEESYAAYMNKQMCSFLDALEIKYEFISSTRAYKSGIYNDVLLKILAKYDEIRNIVISTIGDERKRTYSPFMPICPETGKVVSSSVIAQVDGLEFTTYSGNQAFCPVTDGHCKLQWKVDFPMRWVALKVNFEMFGKDVAANADIYNRICRALDHTPPRQMIYEMFLDADGKKISKSKGSGVTVDGWLRYAPQESLELLLLKAPKKAKKVHYELIPQCVDEYILGVSSYNTEGDDAVKDDSIVAHIHARDVVPSFDLGPLTYSLLLNLVSACNTSEADVVWGYITELDKTIKGGELPFLDKMVECVINYYNDFVKPHKKFREPTEEERRALLDLYAALGKTKPQDAAEAQQMVYNIAKEHNLNVKKWFQGLYQVLLGSDSGPRLGSFIMLYGVDKTRALIKEKAGGE